LPAHLDSHAPSGGQTPASTSRSLETAALAEELDARLDGEMAFEGSTRAIYAHDASNDRPVPLGVTLPRHNEDMSPVR